MASPIPEARPIFVDGPREPPTFVGRLRELNRMKQLWDSASEESSVVKIANMPGIGKTALARQFFRTYGRAEGALCIEINSKDLLPAMRGPIPEELGPDTFQKCLDIVLPQLRWHFARDGRTSQWERVEELVATLATRPSRTFLKLLDGLFSAELFQADRVVLFWDEIQVLYGVGQRLFLASDQIAEARQWRAAHPDEPITRNLCGPLYDSLIVHEQGAFRPTSEVIAAFLKPGLRLVIVSGTQYEFLDKLEDLGSPLRRRTVELRLNRLDVSHLKRWISREFPPPKDPALMPVWEGVVSRVTYLSGGVPGMVQIFVDALATTSPRDSKEPNPLLRQLQRDFEPRLRRIIRIAAEGLDNYILGRVEKFLADFGEERGRQFLGRLATHALFHDYITPGEVAGLAAAVQWDQQEKAPSWVHLVELGLLLLVNGKLERDYIRNPPRVPNERLPRQALAFVCPYQMDLLRRRYIDKAWLADMGIHLTPAIKNLLAMHPGVVGFAVEYYLSLRFLVLTREAPYPLIADAHSPYLVPASIPPTVETLTLPKFTRLTSLVPVEILTSNGLDRGTLYLLPRAGAVDGVFVSREGQIVCYQVKFREQTLCESDLGTDFFSRFDGFVNRVQKIQEAQNLVRALFSLSPPGPALEKRLIQNEFLICAGSQFEKLMSPALVEWLRESKTAGVNHQELSRVHGGTYSQ